VGKCRGIFKSYGVALKFSSGFRQEEKEMANKKMRTEN